MDTVDSEEIPAWDVALEALALEEYKKRNQPMSMDDFRNLGVEHSIRFDDIMATMCQLVMHDKWSCTGKDQAGNALTVDDMDGLFVYGRVEESIADKFSVCFEPVG